jgi:hypothetical protein
LLGSGVATLEFSTDGENFVDSTSTVSASTAGVFGVSIIGVQSIRFRTSTADGTADTAANLSVYTQ